MRSPFEIGDRVSIIPHRSKERDVIGVVTDPCKPTDMVRLDGSAVGFYVMVRCPSSKDLSNPRAEDMGFHTTSLELVR